MILGLSTPQKLGTLFAVVLVVGWAVFILAHVKRSGVRAGAEIEAAPNRKPYFDDDELEGPKLERVLGMALILLVVIAIGLPLYWLREPGRQAGAIRGFANKAAASGFILFQSVSSTGPTHPKDNAIHFGCADCHGNLGQGGSTRYTITNALGKPEQVTWQVPALNTVLLRFTPDTVRTIITYGRAATPMPPWGVAGGGAMNDQMIDNLVAYLATIQLTPAQAQAQAAQYGTDGRALFNAYCARCHTKGYSYGQPSVSGGGAYGPNITGGSEIRQFPNLDDQITYITKSAEYGKAYGARGVGSMAPANRIDPEVPGVAMQGGGMPMFGQMLTPDQIKAIVQYERGL
jgi:mono/diheme cytochrome c family protein